MKNRLLAWAAVAVLAFVSLAPPAHAQVYQKTVDLRWQRTNANTDNTANGNGALYVVSASNGNHNAANTGVARVVEDTSQVIDIRDHALRQMWYASGPTAQSMQTSDTSAFGTLTVLTTKGSIDTIRVCRDVSADGFIWSTLDSTGSHIWGNLVGQLVQTADSIQFVCQPGIDSTFQTVVRRTGSVTFVANPNMGPSSISAEAFKTINFIRFRAHMTAGDYAAAGANDGFTASFVYPALRTFTPSP